TANRLPWRRGGMEFPPSWSSRRATRSRRMRRWKRSEPSSWSPAPTLTRAGLWQSVSRASADTIWGPRFTARSSEALRLVPTSVSDLAVVYVPIGMGSGICGLITVRDLLGLTTEIVGVVAEAAPAFALSYTAGRPVSTPSARTFADGLACRDPQPEPLAIIRR